MQRMLLIALIVALPVAVFAVQNPAAVNVSFLVWQTQSISVSLIVIIAFAVGAFLSFLLGLTGRVRSTLSLRQQRSEVQWREQRIAELERMIDTLRAENEALRAQGKGLG